MLTEYEIRDYRPEDEGSVLALVQQGLGCGPSGTRDKSFWRWKHIDNPFGPSIAVVAANPAGSIVGLRTLLRWGFRAGNTTVNAVRAVDTVTHVDYRRYGVFSALTRRAVDQARSSGVDLIFNTPNRKVLPGYLKLGWNNVSLVRPLVKVLNHPRFVLGLIRSRNKRSSSQPQDPEDLFRCQLSSVDEFLGHSCAIERLLHSCNHSGQGRLYTDRSPDYLRWRYSAYPNAKYGVLYREDNGVLSGCIILRPNRRFNLKEVMLEELLLSERNETLASTLLDKMPKCVDADYVIAYFPEGSFERHVLLKHGFHQVPRNGMNFTANVLASQLPYDPLNFGNWNLSLGDLEVF